MYTYIYIYYCVSIMFDINERVDAKQIEIIQLNQ